MTRHTADYSGFHNKIKPNCKGYTTIHTRMRKYGVTEEVAMKMVDLKRTSHHTKFWIKYNGQKITLKMGCEKFLVDNNLFSGKRTAYNFCLKNRNKFGGVQKAFDHWTNYIKTLYRKV